MGLKYREQQRKDGRRRERHYKIHLPDPGGWNQLYSVTQTGGSNIKGHKTLEEAFEWIRFCESDRPYAQGLIRGDRVMCWNDCPDNAVMRVFYGVVDTHPAYINSEGKIERFRFARPLSNYIKHELIGGKT